MAPLSAIQRRVILALANIAAKKGAILAKAEVNLSDRNTNNVELFDKWRSAQRNFSNARSALLKAMRAAGQDPTAISYSVLERNRISNALSKVFTGPRLERMTYKRGLEAEKKRALANFALWSAPNAFRASPVRMPSPRRKTPSPPRARGPSPRSPATRAREAALGIAGGARRPPAAANNTRITWRRNANGKINRFKTLENINLHLTQAQRNALREMSENQAMNTIRQLARGRKQ